MKEQIKALFPQLEDGLLDFIAQHGTITEFKEGDVLLKTGQYIKSIMLLIEGQVKLVRDSEEGEEFFIYYIGPGSACALSMVCATKSEKSEVSAYGFKSGKLITIPITYMDEMIMNFKSWYYFALETYRSRFEELLTTLDAIAFKSMDERLEFYLLKQVRSLKKFELPITHQQIAKDLNSSREVVSRLLKKMEQEKLIHIHRNLIEIRTGFLQRHEINSDELSS